MTQCNTALSFPFFEKSKLTATFDGGSIVSDGGLLLVRQFDESIGFTEPLARCIYDRRDPLSVSHSMLELVRQRLYQIIAGYEDANDATVLRHDPIFKAVTGRLPDDDALGSQPTLCRLENAVGPGSLADLTEEQVRQFIRTRSRPPTQMTLDMDPSHAPTYGAQQLTFFNGYYDTWMYFPQFLCDAASGFLLASVLRAGNAGAAEGATVLLARTVSMLRAAWPTLRLDFRGDAGFAVPDLLDWLEDQRIPYVIGLGVNDVLERLSADVVARVSADYERTGRPQKAFSSFRYAAHTWPHLRRVIVKVEVTARGVNVRYALATRGGRTADLFEWYHQRGGTIENVIEQLKNGFEGDRLSCRTIEANAFRLLLHTAAYNLMVLFRERTTVPELRFADIQSLRLKLIKVGGRVERSVRRLWIKLSSSWPFASIFRHVHAVLVPGPAG